jgi:hypothetical protein
MRPRFQFSLRNALLATFWVSVWGGTFAVFRKLDDKSFDPTGWPMEL